jgi:hypothetical protein
MAKKKSEKEPVKPTKPVKKEPSKSTKRAKKEQPEPIEPVTEETVKPAEPAEEEKKEELFDLLIPPGVPRKLIMEIVTTYDVEVVSRKEKLYFANMEGDEREILAFRGKKEELEKVHQFMLEGLKKFIGE